MMTFMFGTHTNKADEPRIVEVWDARGNFIAGIYPSETGIKIVSKHLDDVIRGGPGVPSITITFKAAP